MLTVHKAKGLEWHSVYLPCVAEGVFPNTRSRSTPYTSAAVLPYALRGDASDFPTVSTWAGNQGVREFKRDVDEREAAEDRRLAYVAVTRAARRLVVTGHRWGKTQQKPRQVSVYLHTLRELCDSGLGTVMHWEPEPASTETNPAFELDHVDPVAGQGRRRVSRTPLLISRTCARADGCEPQGGATPRRPSVRA